MDDYISREEAVKKIKSCISTAQDAWESGYNTAMAEIMEWIKRMPTADVQPVKHGRWIDTGSGQECSICKEIQYGYDTGRHYCPNCGARMDGDKDNNMGNLTDEETVIYESWIDNEAKDTDLNIMGGDSDDEP